MNRKKKILLLSDDFRAFSGVATVSKEIIYQTVDLFDWVQVGALLKHPDEGKYVDLSADIAKETGIADASVKLFCSSGYGNQDLLRQLILIEKPDAILHFTDPRFWGWLYAMEAEIRQHCPIIYYTIWDAAPAPKYNKPFYESCDMLLCISKLTYKLVKEVLKESDYADYQIKYVPHGINSDKFFPITEKYEKWNDFQQFRNNLRKDYKYVVFYNSRNLRRKHTSDLLLAFKQFCDSVDNPNECMLLLHTDVVDENGTDLQAVIDDLLDDAYNIQFTNNRFISTEELNWIYNSVDVTANIASNEGFGLGTAESVMAGCPIIVNLTGGLQDQAGLYSLNSGFYTEVDYLNGIDLDESTTDVWCKGILPKLKTMQGSPQTPYIWDDLVDIDDVVKALQHFYTYSAEELTQYGMIGREYFMTKESGLSVNEMGNRMKSAITELLDNWKPIKEIRLQKL